MELELTPELKKVIDGLSEKHSGNVVNVYQSSGDTFVHVEADAIVEICRYLKEEHRFINLADIIGTDRFTSRERFEVIYNLVSLRDLQRLFLKVRLEEENPVIDSVTPVWKAANWFERETYDMFGIRFEGHPDLRRILMPEDFEYYPLRKEFPLIGIPGSIELPSSEPDKE
ncbi:MAG: NADH-quinone oxidoreductase subunit C [Balneolaceae bacterium]|nr:NADH-quinone oxidoreductase subunit C [Balneolaceae bacterium]